MLSCARNSKSFMTSARAKTLGSLRRFSSFRSCPVCKTVGCSGNHKVVSHVCHSGCSCVKKVKSLVAPTRNLATSQNCFSCKQKTCSCSSMSQTGLLTSIRKYSSFQGCSLCKQSSCTCSSIFKSRPSSLHQKNSHVCQSKRCYCATPNPEPQPEPKVTSSKKKKVEPAVSPVAMTIASVVAAMALVAAAGWEDSTEKNDPYKDEFLPLALCYRAWDRAFALADSYAAPAQDILLPPKAPNISPYTLVLEIDDVLIHSEWTAETGWRTKKRPGAHEFLNYMCQFYEIVLFTRDPLMNAMPYSQELNRYGTVSHFLYRESTRYENYTFVKDLRHLGRDLSKVIMLDIDEARYARTPDNGLTLPKWDGDSKDRTLIELIPFFEILATSGLHDVRPTLKFYAGKDVVAAFKENQRKNKENAAAMAQKHEEEKSGGLLSNLAHAFFAPPVAKAHFAEDNSIQDAVDAVYEEEKLMKAEKKHKEEEGLSKEEDKPKGWF